MPVTSNSFIVEKLDFIAAQVASLADKMDKISESGASTKATAERAHIRLDRIENDLERMQADIKEFSKSMPWVRAQAWIITGMAMPVLIGILAFLWAVVAHKIEIVTIP